MVVSFSISWRNSLISKTAKGHIKHVREILILFQDTGVTLRLKKCTFYTEKINYLGHVVKPGKLEIASHIADAIHDLKTPQTLTDLRSFLGICNVFRRFVPNFPIIAAPLSKKLMKNQPANLWELVAEELDALAILKEKLILPTILELLRFEGQFTLDTDAYDKQIGCVLVRKQPDSTYRPVEYWLGLLSEA